MSNQGPSEGVDYGKSVLFDVVRHPLLKNLDPKDMIKIVDACERYELEVEEKSKEVPKMTAASYKLCVKPHVLRSMHFMGMFNTAAVDVEVEDLTSDRIRKAIEEVVTNTRTKVPDSRVIEAALVGLRMQMQIEDPRMRVRQLVVDYFERMENIGYSSFKKDNPKRQTKEGCTELAALLKKFRDVFRLRLGKNDPADVEPMQMTLDPKIRPVIKKPRRYSAPQRTFIAAYTTKLHEYGFIAPNPNAWAAAPLLVPKDPPSNFRMTLDYRPVNRATEDTPCPMPHIESGLQDVAKSTVFAKIDYTSGYWQLPLQEDSQDALRFMTPNGVWKPLRTTQGAKKSAPNFRTRVEPCFAELGDRLKAWLDDFLVQARTEKNS